MPSNRHVTEFSSFLTTCSYTRKCWWMIATRILFRPVGLTEMQLIIESGYTEFPPRLTHQPIFYPVLNQEYTEQIARDWNTQDEASGYVGYVTAFDINATYLERFEVKTVGASQHQELWVPAAELEDFNRHIQGKIRIVATFYGEKYKNH